jgi:hypothetical protein
MRVAASEIAQSDHVQWSIGHDPAKTLLSKCRGRTDEQAEDHILHQFQFDGSHAALVPRMTSQPGSIKN